MDTVAALPDERMYAGLAAALGTCGVPAAQQAEVWSLLAGVLHVGNVRFTGEDAAAIVDTIKAVDDHMVLVERVLSEHLLLSAKVIGSRERTITVYIYIY